jgi:hypothetical protein
MFHVFGQYRDPWVLTVLIDRELWGGEGGIGEGADGHRDHAGPAFDDVCNCRAASRTELLSRLAAAVGQALPLFDRPVSVTCASGHRAWAAKALPLRLWQSKQWQTETRTGSPSQMA